MTGRTTHQFGKRLIMIAAAVMFCSAGATWGIVIDYDGSIAPDAVTPDPFSFRVGSSTSWSTNNGELTLNTVLAQTGIWFGNGNHVPSLAVPWQVGTNAEGNYLKVRAKLAPGSDTWSIYLLDRTYTAGFTLFEDHLTWSSPGGSMAFDPTEYHTFEFLLKDDRVTYRLDETTVLYDGPASPQSFSEGIFVIGDGSGSDVSGIGSMIIDHVYYESSPTFEIPEPISAAMLSMTTLSALHRRTSRRR